MPVGGRRGVGELRQRHQEGAAAAAVRLDLYRELVEDRQDLGARVGAAASIAALTRSRYSRSARST